MIRISRWIVSIPYSLFFIHSTFKEVGWAKRIVLAWLWKCEYRTMGSDEGTDGSKKDVANKRGRPEKSASVREKRSTEKWKIEDVPAAKKIGARIWRDENDISKNLERTMSKNAIETRNTKRKNVENCERETKEAGLKNGDGNLYGAFNVTRDFPSDFSSLNTISALRE